MKKGIMTRASKFQIILSLAIFACAASTFSGTLISIAPSDGGNIIQSLETSGGGFQILAPNTENDWTGVATGNISTTTNWSLGHVPTSTEDAVFNASSNGTGARHLDNATAAFGSIDVTATTGTFRIRNQ